MKRIREIVRKLSLTQQLVVIVVLTLSFFLVFIFGTMSVNIDRLVDMQIYDLIDHKQKDVIFNYKNGLDESLIFGAYDPSIVHIIQTGEGQILSNDTGQTEGQLLTQIQIQLDNNDFQEKVNYRYKDSRLYTIQNIEGTNASIATIVSRDYNNSFKRLLVNNIINILMIIIAVILFALFVWVTSIIHPLNVMRNYIYKIRKNEPATLIINREDEIGQLATTLVEMNEEIRHQERVKEEMIQNISHDLKTPIATIISYSEAIKDGVYPYDTLEKSVDVILEHAQRLESKVFSLLTLNRMEYLTSDQNDLEARLDLKEIIEQVIVSSNQLSQDIEIQVVGENSEVTGSVEPWRVVIENLFDNALRYAKHKIVITTDNDFMSIYNDGSHLDVERSDHLFRAYEKGDGGQFGLGLSIVYKVVTNYGYKLKAENTDDGVIFTIGEKNDKEK